jgi:arsenite-transporting ATPase
MPGQEVFDSIQELYLELEEMRSLLLDARISSIRLVVNPEKMVIKEAQRTFTYLNLYGYHTDLVVCNRILPQEVGDSFFDSWKESQERYLELIRQSFDPLPILKAPLLDREVVGLDSLRELGNHIFNGQDPARVFYLGQTQEVRKEGKRHILMVRLPFASKEELTVMEDRDELVVQVGRYRRNIILPRVLIGLSVEEAKLEGDILKVTFKEDRRRRS